MTRFVAAVLAGALGAFVPDSAVAQAKRYPLESLDHLRLHNVIAEPATFQGKRGLRITATPEAARQEGEPPMLAWIEGLDFSNGIIEAEVAGAPASGAFAGARGFVGIAFRLQIESEPEGKATYDAFYLRPTNGRAEDQERRNHAVQYISQPDWPWFRLRKETPSRYEAYVDILPGVWTRVRIDVRGDRARLYVHGQQQPTLIVNDVKSGAQGKGGVALW